MPKNHPATFAYPYDDMTDDHRRKWADLTPEDRAVWERGDAQTRARWEMERFGDQLNPSPVQITNPGAPPMSRPRTGTHDVQPILDTDATRTSAHSNPEQTVSTVHDPNNLHSNNPRRESSPRSASPAAATIPADDATRTSAHSNPQQNATRTAVNSNPETTVGTASVHSNQGATVGAVHDSNTTRRVP